LKRVRKTTLHLSFISFQDLRGEYFVITGLSNSEEVKGSKKLKVNVRRMKDARIY